jgi:imidazolonepropionase-like amidohydrolase
MRHTSFGIVADGADAVRKAARHLLRDGSDFIKVHVSGGVASPSDPIDSLQYTPDELIAAVTEAQHRNTYVAAHAYTPEAIRQAVEAGVYTIEHANLIDTPTAKLLAERGSVMVPTLVTYKGMDEFGKKYGFPKTNIEKNERILAAGLSSLETAMNANVTMGFGTDLIGEVQVMQNQELAIRSEVQPTKDVLASMWQINPGLCHLQGKIGVLAPGAYGDVVVSGVNPLEDIRAFADHTTSISYVIQGGVIKRG